MTRRRKEERAGLPRRRPSVPIRGSVSIDNAAANRRALSKLSEVELLTGKSVQDLDEFHRLQRERVLERYGLRDAA